jgi:hypothetical protein
MVRIVRGAVGGLIAVPDFLYMFDRLWQAADVFHPEGSPETEPWVRERALRILRGEVSQILKGLAMLLLGALQFLGCPFESTRSSDASPRAPPSEGSQLLTDL